MFSLYFLIRYFLNFEIIISYQIFTLFSLKPYQTPSTWLDIFCLDKIFVRHWKLLTFTPLRFYYHVIRWHWILLFMDNSLPSSVPTKNRRWFLGSFTVQIPCVIGLRILRLLSQRQFRSLLASYFCLSNFSSYWCLARIDERKVTFSMAENPKIFPRFVFSLEICIRNYPTSVLNNAVVRLPRRIVQSQKRSRKWGGSFIANGLLPTKLAIKAHQESAALCPLDCSGNRQVLFTLGEDRTRQALNNFTTKLSNIAPRC